MMTYSNGTAIEMELKPSPKPGRAIATTLTTVCCCVLSCLSNVQAEGFILEVNTSAHNSSKSVEPGVGIGAKTGYFNIWGSIDYLTQSEVEYTNITGVGFDSDSILLKAGYDWYFEDSIAISPYLGIALAMDDVPFVDGGSDFIIESGDNQIIGGVSLILRMSESILFSVGAAYLPGYNDDEGQSLLSFSIAWSPFSGSSSSSSGYADTNDIDDEPYFEEEEEQPAEEIVAVQTIEDIPDILPPEPEPEPEPRPRAVVVTPEPSPVQAPIRPVTTKPVGPFSSGIAQNNAGSGNINGVKLLEAAAISFKYGIQLGFYPSESSAGKMIRKVSSNFDTSSMFVGKYPDGFRVFYEGFNQFNAAKEVLRTVRQEFSDAFIKKFR